MTADRPWKVPESVLVVIHDHQHRILLLERADHPGFWQSVTGSLDAPNEPVVEAARREVWEETGIDCSTDRFLDWQFTQVFEIFAHWRHRYAPGVTHNTEHVLSLMVPSEQPIQLSPREHLRYQWLDWRTAAETCFSWTNAEAIRQLMTRQT
jgi:dATP pyrophosphohydrolase